MPSRFRCDCLLCDIEAALISDLSLREGNWFRDLQSAAPRLRDFSSISHLFGYLRNCEANSESDQVLGAILAVQHENIELTECLLILAFLPVLHSAVSRVAKLQPAMTGEDITQQAITLFLQFLHSDELRARNSHFAFAISRTIKRRIFQWARHESARSIPSDGWSEHEGSLLRQDEILERHAQLRHFLHKCVKKDLLRQSELDLLIQFKLGENGLHTIDGDKHKPTNATRQKLKRVLAKLRRLADAR
jgi:hypothetical protein